MKQDFVRIIKTNEVVPVYWWLADGVVAYVADRGIVLLQDWEYEKL